MTRAEKKLRPMGWELAHTSPLHQSFHFERFVERRRVAAVMLQAKSTARAWTLLRKMLVEHAPEDLE